MRHGFWIAGVAAVVVAAAAMAHASDSPGCVPAPGMACPDGTAAAGFFGGTNEIRSIGSDEELAEILARSHLEHAMGGGGWNAWDRGWNSWDGPVMLADVAMDRMAVPEGAMASLDSAAGSPMPGAVPYHSETNVQVEGVDEPDYVKTDGRYIYVASRDGISVVEAYPPEEARLVFKAALDIGPSEVRGMFLHGERLVIFHDGYEEHTVISEFGFMPEVSGRLVTHAVVIDISDRSGPSVVGDYAADGGFRDARMIGGHAYLITEAHIDRWDPRLPVVVAESGEAVEHDAFYFDGHGRFSNFNTVTAIDVAGGGARSETFLMGEAGTVYASADSIYLAYLQGHRGIWPAEPAREQRFLEVIVPLLPSDAREEIGRIAGDYSVPTAERWRIISGIMQDAYNAMGSGERAALFSEIREALREYDSEVLFGVERTVIHRIAVDGGEMEHAAKGSVPGRLLNQFSMDQHGDRFRVATTIESRAGDWDGRRANAVYILDERLEVLDGLDGIAPNESVFSARFMGDRLYLVTFERIDPFFVIDLSGDRVSVLGELKLPGFSDYLHPYGADHVIGIGRETAESGGRVEMQGVKIALFDVSDVSDPRVADDVVIGDWAVKSIGRSNHKAFFLDGESGVMSVPVTNRGGYRGGAAAPDAIPAYGPGWAGFYMFLVDKDDGISLAGTSAHREDAQARWLDDGRTLRIGEALYTVSPEYVKIHLIQDIKDRSEVLRLVGSLDDIPAFLLEPYEVNTVNIGRTGGLVPYLGPSP